MVGLLSRIGAAIKQEGFGYVLKEALPHLHKHYLRDALPRRRTKLNGVLVYHSRLFDNIVPWNTGHPEPENYESEIIKSLNKYTNTGDDIVIVGGGWGISTVVAAEATGRNGTVYTFEASPQYTEYITETAELNNIEDNVEIKNAVVSHTVSVLGSAESDVVVSPSDLPDCDVLELDCEGAEIDILKGIEIRPRVIIVESHGVYGSPTDEVIEQLNSLSYDVVSTEIAEAGSLSKMCEKNDVRVITAISSQ